MGRDPSWHRLAPVEKSYFCIGDWMGCLEDGVIGMGMSRGIEKDQCRDRNMALGVLTEVS